jgi:Carboxypeptidase regulatory-like domain
LLVFSSSVFAQSASVSGDIRGTITDPSGALLPKATVTALDPQTGLHRASVSDANGQFRLAGLPPAIYDLTAELPGFSTQSRKGLVLAIGQTVVFDFRLQVSAVPIIVEVTDQPPIVEIDRGSQANSVPERYVADLPIDRRDSEAEFAQDLEGSNESWRSLGALPKR